MQPFLKHTGLAVAVDRANIDTDQIVPKQFLKKVDRAGMGEALFFNWRYKADGSPDPAFPLNEPRYFGATVLLGGPNFGSGSSREHAVWALQDFGIQVVIAPSFADIFYNNCFKNGLLPVALPAEAVSTMIARTVSIPGYRVTVDLVNCLASDWHSLQVEFQVDGFRRRCLIEGLDEIGLTLQQAAQIAHYEQFRPTYWQ